MQAISRLQQTIPAESNVYTAVKRAWHRSMEVIERLLMSESLKIGDSEPLLGLAAWHLYPDMMILGARPIDIFQEDELFPGGVLTIGMSALGGASPDRGISWSLPLSHLRFYGKPVPRTRALGDHTERVRFDELRYVVLGAVTHNWFSESGGISRTADFMITVGRLSIVVARGNNVKAGMVRSLD